MTDADSGATRLDSAARPPHAPDSPRERGGSSGSAKRVGDTIFSGVSVTSGILILVTLAAVAAFLLREAIPALTAPAEEVRGGDGFWSFVWPLLAGTLISSIIALVIATPVAVLIALFISHYAPKRLAAPIGFVIDLLAAIPSVVFGLWGLQVLAPKVAPFYEWLHDTLGFIPLFGDASQTGRTLFTGSLALAIMILPIITSVSREVFLQSPRLNEEAALALGSTRWEMLKMSVLPFGMPGVIGGTMLGLGRALGETMAMAMIIAPGAFTWNALGSGNNTIPSYIALNFAEARGLDRNALIAAGLVLFALTLAVNLFARWIVDRRSAFSE